MLRTVMMTTSLAAGLLMFDVAQPMLTGSNAEAAQFVRRTTVTRTRTTFTRPKATFRAAPKITRTQTQFRKTTFRKSTFQKSTFQKSNFQKGNFQKSNFQAKQNFTTKAFSKSGPSFGKKQFVAGPGLAKGNFLKLANKSYPIHKGPHRLWWRNGWRTFVPFSAISVALIGGAYYWPDAYVSVARPYCAGVTPDGCQLNWQQVPFAEGDSEWQCVQYCPRPGMAPPANAAALVTAPAAASGGRCELEIFAQPQFSGTNAPSDTDQPRLVDAGWKNEIASVQVKAGTWDFFTDEEFQGENMRLAPGPYPDLGPQWTKKIGSFMCVQGG